VFLSVFDVFKIGVGPSSSHTMGPMIAANAFLRELDETLDDRAEPGIRIICTLYGALAHTGQGHGTHRAVLAGLCGLLPETFDAAEADDRIEALRKAGVLRLPGGYEVLLDAESAIIEDKVTRPGAHPNGMRFAAIGQDGTEVLGKTCYSVGGGFVLSEEEAATRPGVRVSGHDVPYPFETAAEMLEMSKTTGLGIAEMKRANEEVLLAPDDVRRRLAHLWAVMQACISRGLAAEGVLPGGLKVRRRARALIERMAVETAKNDAPLHLAVDWLSAYAMAVNEENAAGGQVVTAPTNGAAGVIPAVMMYYLKHVPHADPEKLEDMLLTAAAIGGLIKYNASISGAEVGCQGEVGTASAMAAAALCDALGGTTAQVENAAEIALEHHLGMTCDPVRGLVQVPCIERNGMGAVKAVAAASLALAGDGTHFVPLDACIETMRQTGLDMDARYKETSLGGLSVAIPGC
jgi:L-serine dehydratase